MGVVLVMSSNDARRSMAHYVQATHIRTRERLADRMEYPIPQIGDIIIYNEQQKYHERHDAAPKRGIGKVEQMYGHIVLLRKMSVCGEQKAIRKVDFALGLYTYVKLKQFPAECPSHAELEIGSLSDELQSLVINKKVQGL